MLRNIKSESRKENEIIKSFFERLYYENDILNLTGVNCFDYENGEVDIIECINPIEKNSLEVKVLGGIGNVKED